MSSRDLFGDHDDDHGNHFDRYFFFDNDRHEDRDNRTPATSLNATVDVTATDGNGHILNGSGNPAAGWEIRPKARSNSRPTCIIGRATRCSRLPSPMMAFSFTPCRPAPRSQIRRTAYRRPIRRTPPRVSTTASTLVSAQVHIKRSSNSLRRAANSSSRSISIRARTIIRWCCTPVYDPAVNAGGSHVVWEDSHNHIVIADDAGNAYVTQNSQNYAFYQSLIDTDPHTHGTQPGPIGPAGVFDIEEQIIAPHNNVIADITSELDLGGATSPTPHNDLPSTALNSTLDVTATDGNGHTLNGSGNPAAGWETQTVGSIQLGTDVHYRTGDTVQPTAVNDDGSLVYNMPAGTQVVDPMHGVSAANPNRAATSFDYSFDTGVGPGPHQTIQDFLASGGQFVFKIDLDPGQHNDPLTLHAVYDASSASASHVVWETAQGQVVIGDDGGNAFVTQNSQNYAFFQSLIDTNPHAPGVQPGPIGPAGTFDVEAQVVNSHHDVIADIHSTLLIG